MTDETVHPAPKDEAAAASGASPAVIEAAFANACHRLAAHYEAQP